MVYRTVKWLNKLSFWVVVAVLPAAAQPRIENIRPVAHQDTITLTYDLVGVQPGQQFRIKAFCWNGYQELALSAINGRTLVGRGKHKLDWRVLSDMDLLVGDSVTFTLLAFPPDKSTGTVEDQKVSLFNELTGQVDSYLEETYNHALPFRDYGEHLYESQAAYDKLLQKLEKWNRMYDTLLMNRRRFEATAGTLWGDDARTDAENFFSNLFEDKHRNLRDSYNDLYKRIKGGADGNYQGQNRRSFIKETQAEIYLLTQRRVLPGLENLKIEAKKLYDRLPL